MCMNLLPYCFVKEVAYRQFLQPDCRPERETAGGLHPIMTGAYAFSCEYSTTGFLLDRLNELGLWEWDQGDSYWYGDYLACRPFPGVRIRIVDFPELRDNKYVYECDVRRRPECQTPMEVIDAAFRKMLEQIPATNVHEIEWFD